MNGDPLLEAAARSAAEVVREEARHTRGGDLHETQGLLLCRGPGRLPVSPNVAMRTAGGPAAAEAFAVISAFYAQRRSGFGLHLRPGPADDDLAALAARHQPLATADSPAMVRRAPLPPPEVDAPVEPVADADGAAAYATVVDDAYQSLGWPAGSPAALFADPGLLLQPHKAAFLVRVQGRPAAAAYVQVTEALGLISWVGTTVAARGRGLGAAVTVAALNAGFELGADTVWLVASPMGEALYRRLGFAEFSRVRSFVLWPDRRTPVPAPPDGAP